MAEQITLAVPETKPVNTSYRVSRLVLDWDGRQIVVQLRGTNGEDKSHHYNGAVALALMNQLNTANLSTNSLHKRVLQRLTADGVVSGTLSGTPD